MFGHTVVVPLAVAYKVDHLGVPVRECMNDWQSLVMHKLLILSVLAAGMPSARHLQDGTSEQALILHGQLASEAHGLIGKFLLTGALAMGALKEQLRYTCSNTCLPRAAGASALDLHYK